MIFSLKAWWQGCLGKLEWVLANTLVTFKIVTKVSSKLGRLTPFPVALRQARHGTDIQLRGTGEVRCLGVQTANEELARIQGAVQSVLRGVGPLARWCS